MYDANNNTPGSTSTSQNSTLTAASLFQSSASNNGFIDISPTTILNADNPNLGAL